MSSKIFIDVNIIGITGNPEGQYLSRSSAKPGDQIAVTGYLGTAAAGFHMLTRKMKLAPSLALTLNQAFARPEPRLNEGLLLIEKGVKTTIDISDGLLADLGHICKASKVCARIDADKLPIRPEVTETFADKSLEMALSGGEDYQLLFTAPLAIINKVQQACDYPVTIIGEILSGPAGKIDISGAAFNLTLKERGFDHFISRRMDA